MSELKDVAIVISGKRIPQQDYNDLVSFFDLWGGGEKISSLLGESKYDIVGNLPPGFRFKSKSAVKKIVNAFNENPQYIALIVFPPVVNGECPYFINNKIIEIKQRINSLQDMLSTIEGLGLQARQATEELFIYEH